MNKTQKRLNKVTACDRINNKGYKGEEKNSPSRQVMIRIRETQKIKKRNIYGNKDAY